MDAKNLQLLKNVTRFLGDLNAESYLWRADPGTVDMRQRSEALQRQAFEAVKEADPAYYGIKP